MVSATRRNSVWSWIGIALALAIGFSAIIAVGTHDDACGTADAPKHWRVFPPGWQCETSF
jgi:hypothetical protein